MTGVTANGALFDCTVQGTGEPVLLVTGSGGRGRMWHAHQVPALVRAGYQVVTFDNRGTGQDAVAEFTLDDMVGDVAGIVGALGLAPCRVVGASLGALVVQELALRQPALLRQAVLIATRGRTDALRRAMVDAEIEQVGCATPLSAAQRGVAMALQNLSQHTLSENSRALDWMALLEGRPDTGPGYRHQLLSTLIPNRLEAYRGIRVPTLVVAFTDDLVTPPHLGREVAAAIPDSTYLQIPRCGHYGHLENPAAVNTALLDFFAAPARNTTAGTSAGTIVSGARNPEGDNG